MAFNAAMLSAVPAGMQAYQQKAQQIQLAQFQLDQAKRQVQAEGAALSGLLSGGQSQPPMPGQPSQPMQAPPMMGAGGMQTGGGTQSSTAAPPMVAGGGGAPQGAPQGQPGATPFSGAPQATPMLSPQQIVQQIMRSNPGINWQTPEGKQILYCAIERYQHLMDPISRAQWEQTKFAIERQDKERQFGIETRRLDEATRRDDQRYAQGERRLDEAARRDDQRYAQGERRADIAEKQLAERERHEQAMEKIGSQRYNDETQRYNARDAETARHNKAMEGIAAGNSQARLQKGNEKVQEQTKEFTSIAKEAGEIDSLIGQNPRLVGGPGKVSRAVGAAKELLGGKEDPAVAQADDFKQRVELLKARLNKALLNSKYFSGPAQAQLEKILPSLDRFDNPTLARQALKRIKSLMEERANTVSSVAKGVTEDLSSASDEEILKTLGVGQ